MSDRPDKRKVYERARLGERVGYGERPAVLVVDLQIGFTAPEISPVAGELGAVIAATNRILAAGRAAGVPAYFTVIGYDAGCPDDAGLWPQEGAEPAHADARQRAREARPATRPPPLRPRARQEIRLGLLRHAPRADARGQGRRHRRGDGLHDQRLRARDDRRRARLRVPADRAASKPSATAPTSRTRPASSTSTPNTETSSPWKKSSRTLRGYARRPASFLTGQACTFRYGGAHALRCSDQERNGRRWHRT